MKLSSSLAVFTLGLGLLAVAVLPRIEKQTRTKNVVFAAETSLPVVAVSKAEAAPASTELVLPATTEPNYVAQIYARTNGYVSSRFVDIGDHVRAGQLLAAIESPELQQELAQAQASLAQAKASYESANAAIHQAAANKEQTRANQSIAQTTFERWDRLVQRGVLPKQEGDERRSALHARNAEVAAAEAAVANASASAAAQRANIGAQEANVRRLQQLISYQRITAPFDGVVTERRVEKGDLVSAGSIGQSSLFTLSQSNTLRVRVNVPQTYAGNIAAGQTATIVVSERPGEEFKGQIVREAGAINAASRTLQVEVQIDNRAGRLLPGMYTQVKLGVTRQEPAVLIPADALYVDSAGTRVATVDGQKRLHFHHVTLGRNLGTTLEVASGLPAGAAIVRNPSDSLKDGAEVTVQN
ncbi:MAG TPA: efflux RND transporter periplasmic adaptor subunit [Bryobacteraceae bacterium]|nr:efflux RND transporter periplasmic adaptor subunit [Bryobacteraceae bacterium]